MIRIGTSGWNYPTGKGTWNGVFYPASRPRGFDELAYYAEHFDTVEVNSTFYRMPEAPMTSRWLARTPASFLFSVKLFQKFTHPDMYLARDGVKDWDVSRSDVDLFRAGIDPLASSGRLGALLLQFPPSFHDTSDTRMYLAWLLERFAEYPLAVELRHRSWSDHAADTHALLAERRAAWTLIDEPKFKDSVGPVPSSSHSVEPSMLYVRLHGRNAAAWWDHEASEDRYNYLYSAQELAPFAATAKAAAEQGKRVLLYLNNHFSAKAVANAAVLKHTLDQPVPGVYPDEMVTRYPDLKGVVTTPGFAFD